MATPLPTPYRQRPMAAFALMTASASTGAGTAYCDIPAKRTFQATVTGTGAVTATVAIEASNDEVGWIEIGRVVLSGTTSATDGFATAAPWVNVRANVLAISGTGAAVTATMGV